MHGHPTVACGLPAPSCTCGIIPSPSRCNSTPLPPNPSPPNPALPPPPKPQVLLKKPASFASDLYALAITINEAATGTYPFSDCTKDHPDIHTILEHGYGRQELAAAVAAEGLRPRLPAGGCPPGYAELIQQCWALDPVARPSAADVAHRLAEIAGQLHEWEAERQAAAGAAAAVAQQRPAATGAGGEQMGDVFRQQGALRADSYDGQLPRVASSSMFMSSPGMTPSASVRTLAALDIDSESGRSSYTGDDAHRSPMDTDTLTESLTEPVTPSGLASPDAQQSILLGARAPGSSGSSTSGSSGPLLSGALGRAAAGTAPPVGMQLMAGAFGAIGPRESMEDRQLMRACLGGDSQVHVVGVFDGHRGHEAAAFAAAALPRALQLASLRRAMRDERGDRALSGAAAYAVSAQPAIGASPAAAALREAFVDVDAAFRSEWRQQQQGSSSSVASASSGSISGGDPFGSSGGAGSAPGKSAAERFPGCTALAAVIAGGRLLVANAGDCRAVLCRGGRAVGLSRQHTAELEDERVRVLAAGGSVARRAGSWRVGAAALQVTRALGDFDLKGPIDGGVTAEPEVVEFALTEEDQFIVLGTDGIWDVMGDQEAVGLIRDTVKDPQLCAKRLVTEALSRGSRDNATAVVVFLRPVGSLESVWTSASGAPAPEATPTFFGSRRAVPQREEVAASADEMRETF